MAPFRMLDFRFETRWDVEMKLAEFWAETEYAAAAELNEKVLSG